MREDLMLLLVMQKILTRTALNTCWLFWLHYVYTVHKTVCVSACVSACMW